MVSYEQIEQHYKEHRQRVLKWLKQKCGDEASAEDVLQESYYRALRYHASCRPEEIGQWISRIQLRCLIDFLNEQKGYFTEQIDEENGGHVECPMFTDQIKREIAELIATKSVAQKEILTLYFEMEYAAKDVAAITEYSYAQCHKTIQRFKQELGELYG